MTTRSLLNSHRAQRTAHAILAPLVAAAALACSESTAVNNADVDLLPLLEADAKVEIQLSPALVQTLQLSPGIIYPGDELEVRSVVRNVSNSHQRAEALVCQLEMRTDMKLEPVEPLILCLAYSMQVDLAPNDSLVLTGRGKVNSRPGRYVLVVRHLLRPDLRARVRVNVHPLPTALSHSPEG